ncbi:hypothetical protein [Bdellovibrio sp. GT3]|uniref:hypothetical protein n=1 Tax=Bdellovibrio sp. GT3 TaxID=3136282 RepID=UPI0030F02660
MVYRYESSQASELTEKSAQKKSIQEINQAIIELGAKAERHACASRQWAEKAFAAALRAKQVFSKQSPPLE